MPETVAGRDLPELKFPHCRRDLFNVYPGCTPDFFFLQRSKTRFGAIPYLFPLDLYATFPDGSIETRGDWKVDIPALKGKRGNRMPPSRGSSIETQNACICIGRSERVVESGQGEITLRQT